VVLDGQPSPEDDEVVDGTWRFGRDGTLEFLAFKGDGFYRVCYGPPATG
jgi:hypothetical protein